MKKHFNITKITIVLRLILFLFVILFNDVNIYNVANLFYLNMLTQFLLGTPKLFINYTIDFLDKKTFHIVLFRPHD